MLLYLGEEQFSALFLGVMEISSGVPLSTIKPSSKKYIRSATARAEPISRVTTNMAKGAKNHRYITPQKNHTYRRGLD